MLVFVSYTLRKHVNSKQRIQGNEPMATSLKVTDNLACFHSHHTRSEIVTRKKHFVKGRANNARRGGERGRGGGGSNQYIFTTLDSVRRFNLHLFASHALYLYQNGTPLIYIIHQKIVTPSYSLKIRQMQNNIPYAIRSFFFVWPKIYAQFVPPLLILVFKWAVS